MAVFRHTEHRAVAKALRSMDHDLLTLCACWFGGGTEIVLDLDEYRLSKDVDFLCADTEGYRTLRSLIVSGGAAALFGDAVRPQRAFRSDQYGIRGMIGVDGIPLRFEIIREGRITLEGRPDRALGVPRLSVQDRITEKLLANADRCQDLSTCYRDAVDLGMLALRHGPFPASAVAKAEAAYGSDIDRKLHWVVQRLDDAAVRRDTADALGMDATLLTASVVALAAEVQKLA